MNLVMFAYPLHPSVILFLGIVQYDADEKRVISAMWAKDEDISRFLRYYY